MSEMFQKQKLNREDHKKIDNAAKNVRNGVGVLGVLAIVGTAAVKYGPKFIKSAIKIVSK